MLYILKLLSKVLRYYILDKNAITDKLPNNYCSRINIILTSISYRDINTSYVHNGAPFSERYLN